MLSSRSILRLVLCAGLAGTMGCKPETPEPKVEKTPEAALPSPPAPPGQTETNDAQPPATNAATVEDVQLDILNLEQTRGLVNKHPGKVVVMDYWATYCPPCIKEFPNLVRLQKEHGDKIACISVSTDFEGLDGQPVETYRDKVMKFLVKQGASFQNVLLSISSEDLFSKIEHQSIPIVYVYDQKGELRGQFPDPKNPDEFTYEEHIIPLVEKLLKGE